MKITLFKILKKKEVIHWKRIVNVYKMLNGYGNKIIMGTLISISLTLWHYGVALMHTLYECTLFIVNNEAFKENLLRQSIKHNVIQNNIK